MGYIIFTDGDMFLIEGPRYVGLVPLWGRGIGPIFSFGGIVIPAIADTTGDGGFALLVAAGDC